MIRTLRATLLSTCLVAGSGALPALAAPLIVLGDSIADAGSARLAAGGGGVADPADGYFLGRFTNGPNVADYANLALNGELTLSYLVGGDNFAFGGAAIVTDINQGTGGLPSTIPDLTDQIDTVLSRGPLDAEADVLVNFVGNDFLAASRGSVDPDLVATQAIASMAQQLMRLVEGGATNVAVSNVAASGFNLLGATKTAAAVERYNDALSDLLVELSATTSTRFALVDRDSVFDRILGDPLTYGFDPSLFGTPCIAVPSAAPACDGYLFFDTVHETTQAMELVSLEAITALQPVPLPGALALFATGLGGVIAARRAQKAEQ